MGNIFVTFKIVTNSIHIPHENVLQADTAYGKIVQNGLLYRQYNEEAFYAGQAKNESTAEKAGNFRYHHDTGKR